MLTLHPKILEKDGEKTYAVLPYEEFLQIQVELEDFEDLKDLRSAKATEADAPTTPLSAVREELDI